MATGGRECSFIKCGKPINFKWSTRKIKPKQKTVPNDRNRKINKMKMTRYIRIYIEKSNRVKMVKKLYFKYFGDRLQVPVVRLISIAR